MSQVQSDLVGAIKALRLFVPAKDFEISKRFYADLGFRVEPLGDSVAAMHAPRTAFVPAARLLCRTVGRELHDAPVCR
jgi:hypothetical protein